MPGTYRPVLAKSIMGLLFGALGSARTFVGVSALLVRQGEELAKQQGCSRATANLKEAECKVLARRTRSGYRRVST